MLKQSSLQHLKNGKNLLAFSGGPDSTALFYLLKDENISFDIAIVNYNTREQSHKEVAYAQELAQTHKLKCHLFTADTIVKNFEAKAREIRYDFFEEIINEHNYNNLLTAHHLGDRFEWMLMQFCKGAGCVELAGMSWHERRDNYTLLRPLLNLDKSELLSYLHTNALKYFEDETNQDERITRNSFRHKHTQPLLLQHLKGIKKSFQYLDEDKDSLSEDIQVHSFETLHYFECSHNIRANIIVLDKYFKQNKYLISAHERKLLKDNSSVVLGRKHLVSKLGTYIFISPYKNFAPKMTKEFKEECRILQIVPKLRPYLYENKNAFSKLKQLLLLNAVHLHSKT